MQHGQIWRAIDALAARRGLSASGLARAAGLDPTTFNKSKRQAPDGKPRWPSTESVSRALAAAETNWDEFAALLAGRDRRRGPRDPDRRHGARGRRRLLRRSKAFPSAPMRRCAFPISAKTASMRSRSPATRWSRCIAPATSSSCSPAPPVRRGDRVVVRTRAGEVMAKVLGRRNDQTIELISLNPAHKPRELAAADIDWIARILWASQ